nr:cytosine deaminase [Quercus suber]
MAAELLFGHGIGLNTELTRIQEDSAQSGIVSSIINATLHSKPRGSTWDITIKDGSISSIDSSQKRLGHIAPVPAESSRQTVFDCGSSLIMPSLCHPHIHLDKAFLLSHPSFNDIQIQKGDFAEAMELTSKAKSNFQHVDLIERGQRVIDESITAGVTHMRAFVEVDAGVGKKCLHAGLELRRTAQLANTCVVQICAFAQLPLFSASPGDADGAVIRGLIEEAVEMDGVDAIGSTPYVEASREMMEKNVEYTVDLCIQHDVHLDLHLDYNLDGSTEPIIWHVLRILKEKHWPRNRTVALGHCTRLTLFSATEWQRLKQEVDDLPITFVGLPTSDLFMMRTPERVRGTLSVPDLIGQYQLNACISINNIGNAFTPHGSCDPITLACNGVGIYQSGTEQDVSRLYECISTRAKEAIGLGREIAGSASRKGHEPVALDLRVGDRADLLIYDMGSSGWRKRRTVSDVVYLYDHCNKRQGLLGGVLTS